MGRKTRFVYGLIWTEKTDEMKIALLTYFAADNYGATLQAYATIKAFEQCGHEVELVNFVIPEPPRSKAKNLLLYPKHLKFKRFRKVYFKHLSRRYYSVEDLRQSPPIADCYLVGSDQTWNPEISKHMAPGFFLDFGDENILRASYAASFGKEDWEDTQWISSEEVKQMLDKFIYLSVRESSGMKLLKDRFGVKNAFQVLDPVLLFDNYIELTGKIKRSNELVLYKLYDSSSFYSQCREIGKKLSLPIRSIGSIRRIRGIKCTYPESIEGWIRRIAGAEYVITDSFHGTVVSILYGRQFVVSVGNPKLITRIMSLLELLGIPDRVVGEGFDAGNVIAKLLQPIDYEGVHEKLVELREDSFRFINSIVPI